MSTHTAHPADHAGTTTPEGGRVTDPSRPMRAVGTSVDPNSFGGLLMVGFVLAAGQLVSRPVSAGRTRHLARVGEELFTLLEHGEVLAHGG